MVLFYYTSAALQGTTERSIAINFLALRRVCVDFLSASSRTASRSSPLRADDALDWLDGSGLHTHLNVPERP